MAPIQFDLYTYKRGKSVQTHTHREHNVKTETNSRVMLLHIKTHQSLPTEPQKLGDRHGTVSLTALRRNQLSLHLDFNF